MIASRAERITQACIILPAHATVVRKSAHSTPVAGFWHHADVAPACQPVVCETQGADRCWRRSRQTEVCEEFLFKLVKGVNLLGILLKDLHHDSVARCW